MRPPIQMSDSSVRTSIEVRGSSYSEEYELDARGDEAMDEPMDEPADDHRRFEPRSSPELGDGGWNSEPEDEREPSDSPSGGDVAAARFRGVSRGPLGAQSIVNNRQFALAQIRETEDLLRSAQADDRQASMADEYVRCAGVDADFDKLAKGKSILHERLKGLRENKELRVNKVQEWTAKFDTLAGVEPHRLASVPLCDKLPADVAPALLRLATFSCQDDDSIDRLPQKYKDLIGQDVHLLAQKALPPAPSQDVTVLRRELAAARADAHTKSDAVTRLEGTISELQSDQVRQASVQDDLETKISDLTSRHKAESVRMDDRFRKEEKKKTKYKRYLEKSNEKCERLNVLLVEGERENERLSALARDVQRREEQKDATIEQLDEHIKAFRIAEEGSRPALDVLKDSVDLLREQKKSAESLHEKEVASLRERAQSENETHQRKINQLSDKVTKLEREKGKIRLLEGENHDLKQSITDFTAEIQTLRAELASGAAREEAACKEKRTLEGKNSGLRGTIESLQARFDGLGAKHGYLETREKSLLDKIEELKRTIGENDLNRHHLVQNLRKDVDTKSNKCEEFRVEIERLRQEARAAEKVISTAQLQREDHAQVSAELAVQTERVSFLEGEKGHVQQKLDTSEGERMRLQERLDVASSDIISLRIDARGDKASMDSLREDRTKDQEKIRGLESNLKDVNSQLTGRVAAVSCLEERLRSKEGEVTKLLADVARLGTNEEEHKQCLALEQAEGRKLQTQVSDAKTSLATERQRVVELQGQVTRLLAEVAQLGKMEEEHKKSIGLEQNKGQRLQAQVSIADTSLDIARRRVTTLNREKQDLTAKLESQETRVEEQTRQADNSRKEVQRLQVTVAELKKSLELLQNEKVESARGLGALQESFKRESSGLSKLREDSEATNARLRQLNEQYRLREAEAEAHKAEANKMGSEVTRLTTELSSMKESVGRAEDRAVHELQHFLSRLCLAPARDPGVFEGLARQLQVPGVLEAQGPAVTIDWTILETWGDEVIGETIHLPEGLEMLVLELYRTAVVGVVGTRKCHQALLRALEAVRAGTVIHAGVFGEMAKIFVQAIAARPDEGFEAGLVLWQLLDVVQQRWGPPNLDKVKGELAASLRAHEYSDVFDVVARRGQFLQCDDCHFFSDTSAVFARENNPRAVLIDVEGQSIRFFSKARWAVGMLGYTIKPLGGHPKVCLQSNSVHGVIWAEDRF